MFFDFARKFIYLDSESSDKYKIGVCWQKRDNAITDFDSGEMESLAMQSGKGLNGFGVWNDMCWSEVVLQFYGWKSRQDGNPIHVQSADILSNYDKFWLVWTVL